MSGNAAASEVSDTTLRTFNMTLLLVQAILANDCRRFEIQCGEADIGGKYLNGLFRYVTCHFSFLTCNQMHFPDRGKSICETTPYHY